MIDHREPPWPRNPSRSGSCPARRGRCREEEVMNPQASNPKPQGSLKSKNLIQGCALFGTSYLQLVWCLVLGAWCFSSAAKPTLSSVQCYPSPISLTTANARQAIVVQATYADGITADVTTQARFQLVNPRMARLDVGEQTSRPPSGRQVSSILLSPLCDGKTELRVTRAGRSPAPLSEVGGPPRCQFGRNNTSRSNPRRSIPSAPKALRPFSKNN